MKEKANKIGFHQKLAPSPRIINASITQDYKLKKMKMLLALPVNVMLIA